MKQRFHSPAYYFGWVCIALLGYLLYLNLIPHWSYDTMDILFGDPDNDFKVTLTPSIQGLAWLPKPQNADLVAELRGALTNVPEVINGNKNLIFQQFITLPIAAFLLAAVGIVVSAIFGHKWYAPLFTLASGLATFITFSSNELFTMDLHLIDSSSIGTLKTFGLIIASAGAVHFVLTLLPWLLKKCKKAPAAEAEA